MSQASFESPVQLRIVRQQSSRMQQEEVPPPPRIDIAQGAVAPRRFGSSTGRLSALALTGSDSAEVGGMAGASRLDCSPSSSSSSKRPSRSSTQRAEASSAYSAAGGGSVALSQFTNTTKATASSATSSSSAPPPARDESSQPARAANAGAVGSTRRCSNSVSLTATSTAPGLRRACSSSSDTRPGAAGPRRPDARSGASGGDGAGSAEYQHGRGVRGLSSDAAVKAPSAGHGGLCGDGSDAEFSASRRRNETCSPQAARSSRRVYAASGPAPRRPSPVENSARRLRANGMRSLGNLEEPLPHSTAGNARGSSATRTVSATSTNGGDTEDGAAGSTATLLDADRKLSSFKAARELGKTVCVCGASSYWERERVAVRTERLRIKNESEKLRNELVALKHAREKMSSKLLDIEALESRVMLREQLVESKAAAAATEERRLQAANDELRRQSQQCDHEALELRRVEKELELNRKRHQHEVEELAQRREALRSQEAACAEQRQKLVKMETNLQNQELELQYNQDQLLDLERQLSDRNAELTAKEQQLSSCERQLKQESADLQRRTDEQETRRESLDARSAILQSTAADLDTRKEAVEKEKCQLDVERRLLRETEAKILQDKTEIEMARKSFEDLQAQTKSALQVERRQLEEMKQDLKKKELELETLQTKLSEQQSLLFVAQAELKTEQEQLKIRQRNVNDAYQEAERLRELAERERRQAASFQEELDQREVQHGVLLAELQTRREQLEREAQLLNQEKTQMAEDRDTLTTKAKKLRQREAVLQNQESRSEWYQSAMKEVVDFREKHELQRSDLELEKRAFAELKAQQTAQQEKIATSLRLKEDAVVQLQANLQQRLREVERREILLNNRISEEAPWLKQKLLTVPSSIASQPPFLRRHFDASAPAQEPESLTTTAQPSLALLNFPNSNNIVFGGTGSAHSSRVSSSRCQTAPQPFASARASTMRTASPGGGGPQRGSSLCDDTRSDSARQTCDKAVLDDGDSAHLSRAPLRGDASELVDKTAGGAAEAQNLRHSSSNSLSRSRQKRQNESKRSSSRSKSSASLPPIGLDGYGFSDIEGKLKLGGTNTTAGSGNGDDVNNDLKRSASRHALRAAESMERLRQNVSSHNDATRSTAGNTSTDPKWNETAAARDTNEKGKIRTGTDNWEINRSPRGIVAFLHETPSSSSSNKKSDGKSDNSGCRTTTSSSTSSNSNISGFSKRPVRNDARQINGLASGSFDANGSLDEDRVGNKSNSPDERFGARCSESSSRSDKNYNNIYLSCNTTLEATTDIVHSVGNVPMRQAHAAATFLTESLYPDIDEDDTTKDDEPGLAEQSRRRMELNTDTTTPIVGVSGGTNPASCCAENINGSHGPSVAESLSDRTAAATWKLPASAVWDERAQGRSTECNTAESKHAIISGLSTAREIATGNYQRNCPVAPGTSYPEASLEFRWPDTKHFCGAGEVVGVRGRREPRSPEDVQDTRCQISEPRTAAARDKYNNSQTSEESDSGEADSLLNAPENLLEGNDFPSPELDSPPSSYEPSPANSWRHEGASFVPPPAERGNLGLPTQVISPRSGGNGSSFEARIDGSVEVDSPCLDAKRYCNKENTIPIAAQRHHNDAEGAPYSAAAIPSATLRSGIPPPGSSMENQSYTCNKQTLFTCASKAAGSMSTVEASCKSPDYFSSLTSATGSNKIASEGSRKQTTEALPGPSKLPLQWLHRNSALGLSRSPSCKPEEDPNSLFGPSAARCQKLLECSELEIDRTEQRGD